MLVFVGHNGKTLELNVQPTTRVLTVQEVLATVTNIQVQDQILICGGRPLEAAKELSAYNLAGGEDGGADVFLFNRTLLRPGAPLPPAEFARPLDVQARTVGETAAAPHPLDGASSPLVRALPAYERQFCLHLQRAEVALEVARQRQREAAELVGEMAVQGRAIEEARSNVEHHYRYILGEHTAFMQKYTQQRRAHDELLAEFERDLKTLAAIELHPAAQTPEFRRLSDLVPVQVASLEALFAALSADMEAVFLQAPSVQMDALASQLNALHTPLDEQASIAQMLQSDYGQIQRLVAAAIREVSEAATSRGVTPLDSCQLMETMNESHEAELLPKCEQCCMLFERFYARCVDDKNALTRDAVGQLQKIAAQQSSIRAMRNKLAIFSEAAAKEDECFAELLLLRRVPAAYRQCLAECMRRQAFQELYAAQAAAMAEKMGRLRGKECNKRDAFKCHIQRYVPGPLLAGLGLLAQPAHCQISLPPPPPGAPSITLDDLRRLPTFADPVTAASKLLPFGQPAAQPAGSRLPSNPPSPRDKGFAPPERPGRDAELAEISGAQSLEIENARLRAELAGCYADQAMRVIRASTFSVVGEQESCGSNRESQLREAGSQTGETAAEVDEASKVRAALAATQELVLRLERHLSAARQQNAAYEGRIRRLEGRLHRAASSDAPEETAAASLQLQESHSSGASSAALETVTELILEAEADPAPLALTPVANSPARSPGPSAGPILDTAAGAALILAQVRGRSPSVSSAASADASAGDLHDGGGGPTPAQGSSESVLRSSAEQSQEEPPPSSLAAALEGASAAAAQELGPVEGPSTPVGPQSDLMPPAPDVSHMEREISMVDLAAELAPSRVLSHISSQPSGPAEAALELPGPGQSTTEPPVEDGDGPLPGHDVVRADEGGLD